MKTHYIISIFVILSLLFGCAPTAPSTPAIPPTKPPTIPPQPTETTVPFNLTLTISDEQGQPILGAVITAPEQTIQSDADGIASLQNLPTNQVELQVTAQGYQANQLSQLLQPGDNQATITLVRDPFGLLLGEACAPGEKLLYIEDFQDGKAQGWDSVEAGSPGWTVEEDPDQPGNLMLAARPGIEWAVYRSGNATFTNAVWRLRVKTLPNSGTILNWHLVEQNELRYMIILDKDNSVNLTRKKEDFVNIGRVGQLVGANWHLIEIGSLEDALTIYLDGEKGMEYKDPSPWGGGLMALENHLDSNSAVFYDNLSVCELTTAFQPLPAPKTGYDLSITLSDAEGKGVAYAQANIAELGNRKNATQVSNETGLITWNNLPGGTVTLNMSAPGYKSLEQTLTLEKDKPAQETFTLERDPFGLLPEQACASSEKLLYVEDFQDNKAQGWTNISAALDLNAQNGWSIVPDETGNLVLSASAVTENVNDYLEAGPFENAVWRLKVMYTDSSSFLNWQHTTDQGDWRYILSFGNGQAINLNRFTSGNGILVAPSTVRVGIKKWNFFEVSSYKGVIEVWLNGKKVISYSDPQPLPPGTIGLEAHFQQKPKAVFYYDNLAICELSAPFTSLLQP